MAIYQRCTRVLGLSTTDVIIPPDIETYFSAMSQTLGLPHTQGCLLAQGLDHLRCAIPVQTNRRHGQAW